MNTLKFSLIIVLTCALSFSLTAQSARLKRANDLFKRLNYTSAIEMYLSILDNQDIAEAKINLAECYRKINNASEAEYWYGQVVRLPEAQPVHKLYYAHALQSNGKCDQAQVWYAQYLQESPEELRSNYQNLSCQEEHRNRMSDIGVYTVKIVPEVNSGKDDFGPAIFGNKLVFSSDREHNFISERTHTWTGRDFHQIYASQRTNKDSSEFRFGYGKPTTFSAKLNTRFHDGPICFSADGKQIFFTRNNLVKNKAGKDDEGIIRLKIFYADNKGGDTWGEAIGLPFNSDEYSVAHPSLSANGETLYFASDMPGGFGGMDIYMSLLENGRWSPPLNMNSVIPGMNTEGNEVFPYIFTYDGKNKLYFSSDGHTGLGGLDIYYAEQVSNGPWGPIFNMGEPLNSRFDDHELILNQDGTHGYFVSSREGGVGLDDIYSWSRVGVEVELFVYDEQTGAPIEAATVVSPECLSSGDAVTGSDGKYRFSLPKNRDCTFKATKETYLPNTVNASTKDHNPSQTLFVQIPLKRITDFELIGVAMDQDLKPLPGVKITLTSNCGEAPRTIVTDESGAYTFKLKENCCYTLRGEKEFYFADEKKEICAKGPNKQIKRDLILRQFGEKGKFGEPDKSYTIRIEHIYYDFDKWYIREDATPRLEQLLSILQKNPELVVELASHTDARASHKYNEKLSQNRAQAVVDWLVQRGIERDRLVPRGYGETQPVNECINGVECSEEQHQLNRRTEFTVIGKTDGTRYQSARPSDIKIDPANPSRKWVWE